MFLNQTNTQLYGEDPEGSVWNEFDQKSVEVPDTFLPLTDRELSVISHIISTCTSVNYGVDIYLEIKQIISGQLH